MKLLNFLWFCIKPYKWWYFIMLLAPIFGGLYPVLYNYSIKLFINIISSTSALNYSDLIEPICIFIGARLMLDFFWRLAGVGKWKAEPFVRKNILLKAYDSVQHLDCSFFQNNLSSSVTSKIKGIVDGYEALWKEISRGWLSKVFKSIVSILAISFVNIYLGTLMLIWSAIFISITLKLSFKLKDFSFR